MNLPDRFTCEEMFRKVDDYLDRRLSVEEMRLVEAHLETCARCTHEYRFEATVIAQVRDKLHRLDVPADFAARLHARLSKAAGGS